MNLGLRILLSIPVSLSLALGGCIHVASEETRTVRVEKSQSGVLTQKSADGSTMNYLVYRDSILPLEQFFTRLKKGEYTRAFREINLNYRPANHDNEAMQELLDAGFVPVYVKIENKGTSNLDFDEKSFEMKCKGGSAKAFYAEYLPREFEHVNSKAIAANVYNVGVVIVGFGAVIVALIMASENKVPRMDGMQVPGSMSDVKIVNSATKKHRVDYKNYLLTKTRLAPEHASEGLLFFQMDPSRSDDPCDVLFQAS